MINFSKILTKFNKLALLVALAITVSFSTCPLKASPFKKNSLIIDAQAHALVESILGKLCQASGRLSIPRIYFILSPDINAFANEQNSIYVNTGTFVQLTNVEQLIGILAHELGHIMGGHIHRLQSELVGSQIAQVMETLAGMAAIIRSNGISDPRNSRENASIDASSRNPNEQGSSIALNSMASYILGHEKEADAAGYKLLQKSKLPAIGMVELFSLISKKSVFQDTPFIKTHPTSIERINTLKSYLQQQPFASQLPEDWEYQFACVQAKFMAFIEPAAKTLNFFKNKQTVPAFIARAIIENSSGKIKSAIALLNEALNLKPKDPYLLELAGQLYIESGEFKQAISSLKKALTYVPQATPIRLMLAQAMLENKDDIGAVISQLERCTLEQPREPQGWYLLINTYKQSNMPEKADIAQSELSLLTGDFALAKARAKRALKSKNAEVVHKAKSLIVEIDEVTKAGDQ